MCTEILLRLEDFRKRNLQAAFTPVLHQCLCLYRKSREADRHVGEWTTRRALLRPCMSDLRSSFDKGTNPPTRNVHGYERRESYTEPPGSAVQCCVHDGHQESDGAYALQGALMRGGAGDAHGACVPPGRSRSE